VSAIRQIFLEAFDIINAEPERSVDFTPPKKLSESTLICPTRLGSFIFQRKNKLLALLAQLRKRKMQL